MYHVHHDSWVNRERFHFQFHRNWNFKIQFIEPQIRSIKIWKCNENNDIASTGQFRNSFVITIFHYRFQWIRKPNMFNYILFSVTNRIELPLERLFDEWREIIQRCRSKISRKMVLLSDKINVWKFQLVGHWKQLKYVWTTENEPIFNDCELKLNV